MISENKVYIFLADGFEEIEALTVVDLLRRVNVDVTMVSVSKELVVTGGHNIKVIADVIFEEADFKDANMYIIPGGLGGTNRLSIHEGLDHLLREAKDRKIKLAAICAGPSVLGMKGLLQGKHAVCYPGFEDKLLGATYEDMPCVQDGDVITSKGMGTSIEFALHIVENFVGLEMKEKLAETIQFKEV